MAAEHRTDICIIGAGPVGLFAVFECGMLKMHCHVIDALDMTGGQCAALYPEKPIYDIPGYPAIDAVELIAKLEQQVAPFHPVYHLGRRVGRADRRRRALACRCSTTAAASMPAPSSSRRGWAPSAPTSRRCPASRRYEGKGVFYLVKRREDFRGQRIVIAGGGDFGRRLGASPWPRCAEVVYMVHRRAEIPRRTGERHPHGGARQERQDRDGGALSARRHRGRTRRASPP